MTSSIYNEHKHPKVIAHRGNSSQAPENTYAAFRQAIKLKVDFLECDVQLSKDEVPVIAHDSTFHRITKNSSSHAINALDLEEIKKIDIGSWFDHKFEDQRILTLTEFLHLPKGRIGVMLDIKEETVTERRLAKVVADCILAFVPYSHSFGPILVGSLNPNILLCMESYLPEQKCIPIVKCLEDLPEFHLLNAKYYAIDERLLSSPLIQDVHERGAEVWSWTVNDKPRAIELLHLGVDGLITNHPKKMMALHEKNVAAMDENLRL